MSKKEQASGEYKQVVDAYPSRGVIEIQHPNDTNRENRKMFTYDAVYDKKYVHKHNIQRCLFTNWANSNLNSFVLFTVRRKRVYMMKWCGR